MGLQTHFEEFTERDWLDDRPDEPVRVAVLGLGWWTREQATPAIQRSDYCEATVAISSSREKATQLAERHDMDRAVTYDEYHDGAAADAYDAVYVCTPNATHLEFVKTAADLGKAVLCEKPMEATSERARRMVDACDEAGVTLMIAYRMHTEPAVRRAKQLVQSGFVGTPYQVDGHMSDRLLDHVPDTDQWRLNPDLAGGTAVADIGIYPLNTARFVLDADPVAVYGTTASTTDPFERVDEHAAFQVEFPDDVTASCTVSHNEYTSSRFAVYGTKGKVTVEPAFFPWDDRRLTADRAGVEAAVEFEQIDQMTEEFDYFAACLRTDTELVADGRHGLVDMEAIEAIYESAETGARVALE